MVGTLTKRLPGFGILTGGGGDDLCWVTIGTLGAGDLRVKGSSSGKLGRSQGTSTLVDLSFESLLKTPATYQTPAEMKKELKQMILRMRLSVTAPN